MINTVNEFKRIREKYQKELAVLQPQDVSVKARILAEIDLINAVEHFIEDGGNSARKSKIIELLNNPTWG